jgi:hypothetical protein
MKTGTLQLTPRKARLLPVGLVGLLSLFVLLLWWSGAPAVFAEEHEEKSQDSQRGPGPGEMDENTLRCILGILGRAPSNLQDLTDEEKGLVAQACLGGGPAGAAGGGQLGPGGRAGPDDQSTQCMIRVLGRIPAGPNDFTDDEKRLVAQTCFGPGGGGGSSGVANGAQGGPDEAGMQCILKVLGRMPSGPDDLTEDEKRLVGQACFDDGRGGSGGDERGPQGQRGPGGSGGPDDADMQCILEVLGRMPTGPGDFTNEEKRRVGQACFSDGRGGPRGDDGGPQGAGGPDDATMQCISETLGRMPTGPDDFT